MSDYFESRTDCPAIRKATAAYIATLLEDLLPAARMAARGCGWAIAVHGSLARDIDLVAIPWTSTAMDEKVLVDRLLGAIASVLGRATLLGEWTNKPHGRKAAIIVTSGEAEIDLSIMRRDTPAGEEVKPDEGK